MNKPTRRQLFKRIFGTAAMILFGHVATSAKACEPHETPADTALKPRLFSVSGGYPNITTTFTYERGSLTSLPEGQRTVYTTVYTYD